MHGLIYVATNRLNGLRYIGQTHLTVERRSYKHMEAVRAGSDSYFHCALRKYGVETFDFIEIDKAESQTELDYMEGYWIRFYRTRDRSLGYNTKGGGQLNGGTLNEEVKRKIGNANRGSKRSPEARAKMSARKKGIPNPAHSARMKALRKANPDMFPGKPHTEEAKRLMSESKQGQHSSRTTEYPSVPLQCVETGEIFPSVSAAARYVKVCNSCFSRLKANPNAVVGGLHWIRLT